MDHIFSEFLLLLKVKGRRGNDIVECLDHLEICSQVRAPQLRGRGMSLSSLCFWEILNGGLFCVDPRVFFFFF